MACNGAGGLDLANMTNIAASCGLVVGVPQRADGVEDIMFIPGSKWKSPLYSCITVAQALIRTVTFVFNTTDDLAGLGVVDIADKQYLDEDALPLWGVENIDNTTGLFLMDVNPIWGLISPNLTSEAIAAANISTLRRDSLLLPGYPFLDVTGKSTENLPGVDFPAATVGTMQNGELSGGLRVVDYSGSTNLAMSRRWSKLSLSADSVSKIRNLIWTDIAANAVLGTKGLHQNEKSSTTEPPPPAVTVYHRRIQYHLPYAIPAMITVFSLLVTSMLASAAAILGRISAAKMKRFLNVTSAGRIMNSILLASTNQKEDQQRSTTNESKNNNNKNSNLCKVSDTKGWVKSQGQTLLVLGMGRKPELLAAGVPVGEGEEAAHDSDGDGSALSREGEYKLERALV